MSEIVWPPYARDTPADARRAARNIEQLKHRGSGDWHIVGADSEPDFQNGHTDAGGTWAPTSYRWVLGSGFEYVININIGAPLTVVWNLPAGFYDPRGDLPVHGFNDAGSPLAFKIVAADGGGFLAGDVVHLGP